MTLQQLLFAFQGRLGRKAYWLAAAIFVAAEIVAGIVDRVLFGSNSAVLSALVSLAAFVGSLSVSIRRFHDRDKSGWWVLIGFLPLIGWLWILIENGFLRGTVGPNRYGADPVEMARSGSM